MYVNKAGEVNCFRAIIHTDSAFLLPLNLQKQCSLIMLNKLFLAKATVRFVYIPSTENILCFSLRNAEYLYIPLEQLKEPIIVV